jgi:hypothetical protein
MVAGGVALGGPEIWAAAQTPVQTYDIVVYGGTSAGVTAAIQAARMSKSVALVCPETHLGGMTTSGLGWTDTKSTKAIGGLAREFYHRVWQYYQSTDVWTRQTRESYSRQPAQVGLAMDEKTQTMWTFEPHAAERVLEQWLAGEKVAVFRGDGLDRKHGVTKSGGRITEIRTLGGKRYRGRMFIDAGYEGDLMAAAGVRFRIGRDSAEEYHESLNGVRFMVPGANRYYSADEYAGIDPYVVPGKPSSGLIAGIEGVFEDGPKLGEADSRLQSFNYRLCLAHAPDQRVPITQPDGYDEQHYELLFRLFAAGQTAGFSDQPMPNHKTDSNDQGRMSFDFIGGDFSATGHWNYSDADDALRRRIVADHRRYQQGLIWTLQNHPRTPEAVRAHLGIWGLAADEFTDNGHWPYQLYVREARRMVGQTVVTEHHVRQERGYKVSDPIGLGSYSLDSHVVRRVVSAGKIRNEGGFYVYWPKPYPIPYGAIVPQRGDAANLLAPVTLSTTHAAFGSFRMEPTYMLLGQAAATAAALALDSRTSVQDVDYNRLRTRLLSDGQVLSPP